MPPSAVRELASGAPSADARTEKPAKNDEKTACEFDCALAAT
jgi:hypothetical protein